ncbi:MAG: Asp-tRNA(Asn)/Glu-tRNA(Gln) amidotransferase subunit GatB [Patescibacteria group bacterium]
MEDYEVVIGLETHAELRTESKIFCGCATGFGRGPNTQTCPVCLGLPGALPVLNRRAVALAVKAGLALNCRISSRARFDRKQYFYPDLPKAYQISQFDQPLCGPGHLEITVDGAAKRIGIERVHLEEEAGKSVHSGASIVGSEYSLMDYNRCGIPLIEIVSRPDLRSPLEARLYLEKLRTLLLYAGVSDCKMEEGSLRCDANISVRPKGRREYGVRVEIKNMNSFRAVQAALAHEAERQIAAARAGDPVRFEETRTWDEAREVTVMMRRKEEASDYRYFPEPDLPPVVIGPAWLGEIRSELPEMPDSRRARYIEEWGLPAHDADRISASREMADFFEAAAAQYGEAKAVANWVMGEMTRLMHASHLEMADLKLTPGGLVGLLRLIDDGTISGTIAKAVFEEMFATGAEALEVIGARGLVQISDADEIGRLAEEVIAANPDSVRDYLAGKDKALGFLVGQIMKATGGKANPGLVNQVLREKLGRG